METSLVLDRFRRPIGHLKTEVGQVLSRLGRAIQTVDRVVQPHRMGLGPRHNLSRGTQMGALQDQGREAERVFRNRASNASRSERHI
jgi:hypothetical protein